MKQGYIIARIDVHDAETYAKYTAQTPIVAAQFGGEFIVRGGQCEQAEGAGRARQVVIRFPSYARAVEFYQSPEYQAILPLALAGSNRELVIVEGA